MKAAIVLRQRTDTGARVPISEDPVLIGRNDDNDIVLESPRVSRYHARIVWTGSLYRLEDFGSRNGTWLNGTRLDEPSALRDGDLIQIGDVALVFEVQGQQTISMAEGGRAALDGLTRRESEILGLVAKGKASNQEIAESLVLSVRTVERHMSNIYLKTGTRNRVEASAYAASLNIA